MAVPTVAEVGVVYDLLLATRDGLTLPCKNKDGQVVNLASLAFMTSANAQSAQHEETELQHKDQLIQLASSTLIDREFEQWPQVTQGDWSGGIFQRVLSGGTPLTSFSPQSDPTRYWDGIGLIWPVNSWLPRGPIVLPATVVGAGTQFFSSEPTGCYGGFMTSSNAAAATVPGEGFLIEYHDGAGNIQLAFYPGWDSANPLTLASPFGAGVPALAMTMATRGGWAIASPTAATISLYAITAVSNTALGSAPLAWITDSFNSGAVWQGVMTSAVVGNQEYVAAAVSYVQAGGVNSKVAAAIWNITQFGTPVRIDLPFEVTDWAGGPAETVLDIAFSGTSLYFLLSDQGAVPTRQPTTPPMGHQLTIVGYDVVSATFTTVATINGASGGRFCAVSGGGSLFIVTDQLDMYLLTGGNLLFIESLLPRYQNDVLTTSAISGLVPSRPVAFGPYAIFGVYHFGVGSSVFDFYAYDVVKGRLFRIHAVAGLASFASTIKRGWNLAAMPFWTGNKGTASQYIASLALAFPLDWTGTTSIAQVVTWGERINNNLSSLLLPGGGVIFGALLRAGFDVVSSMIDLTNAAKKLFRQVLADFPPLVNDVNATVQLSAWLDRTPETIVGLAPDFGPVSITGAAAPGATQLKLPINKMARKLIYRVVTTGGVYNGTNWVNAPEVTDVVVQVATGWTRTMTLDLADNAMTNAKAAQETVWSRQSLPGQPAVDATTAYNYLRQLWRLKGGEVTATFPNGDSGPWLLQDMHWDSPKPFGVSYRADQRSSLGYTCQLKMREDI
jgi:hypothetical protein